jgi:hypothetical protein
LNKKQNKNKKMRYKTKSKESPWRRKHKIMRIGSDGKPIVYEVGVESDLRGADLSGEALNKVDLFRADFRDANLENAYLINSSCNQANFEGANLKGVDFMGACLWKTDFRQADLRGANFEKAHLWATDLRGADLEGAIFDRAILRQADLRGANLLNVDFNCPRIDTVYIDGPEGKEYEFCNDGYFWMSKLPYWSRTSADDFRIWMKEKLNELRIK